MFIGSFLNKIALPGIGKQTLAVPSLETDCEVSQCSKQNYTLTFFGSILGVENDKTAQKAAEVFDKNGLTGFAGLDGCFTIVINKGQDVYLVRDHHGTHSQIYYSQRYFASSLVLLMQADDQLEPKANEKSLSRFLNTGYVATPEAAILGVKTVSAGSVLCYVDGVFSEKPLFDTTNIKPVKSQKSIDDYSKIYGELHEEAIKQRIGDSTNVGILLSGGYDSGSNLAGLRRVYDGKISSYSIGFKGDSWTELPLARLMSKHFDTSHHEYEIDGSEIMNLPEIIDFMGNPFVEGGLMVNYCVMKLIGNDKPDVILGGDGSDQYFGTSARECAIRVLASRFGASPLMKKTLSMFNSPKYERDCKQYRVRFQLEKIMDGLRGDNFGLPDFMLRSMLKNPSNFEMVQTPKPNLNSFEDYYVQHAIESDLHRVIDQIILFKASRMAEMFGNKLTFPFMDTKLYNFLQTLPVEFKANGNGILDIARGRVTTKYLLKYHYKPLLPKEITSKKKQGGFAPMPLFFKSESQRKLFTDYILQSNVCRDFLNREQVEKFLKTYDTESKESANWFWYRQNKAIQYFNILSLAIWWEHFIEGKKGGL